MPEIRDLGVINGEVMRGYEIDFETVEEPWSVYVLDGGTQVRVKNTARKMFVLVDENDQPLLDEHGDPKVLVEAEQIITPTEAGRIPRDELFKLMDAVEKEHAWLLNELANR